jgi:hypothetical protein
LINSLKKNTHSRRKSRASAFDILAKAKESGNSPMKLNLNKVSRPLQAIDTVSTMRVIQSLDNNAQGKNKIKKNSQDSNNEDIPGIEQARKLSKLEKFFIVIDKQQKYSKVTQNIKKADDSKGICKEIDNFHRRNKSSANEIEKKETKNLQKKDLSALSPCKIYASEARMIKIDKEIKEMVEEAVLTEIQKQKTEKFHPISLPTKKQKAKIESKIKKLRQIDPVFLDSYKKKSDNSNPTESIHDLLYHCRSSSASNLSPSFSRITITSKEYNPNLWFDSLKKNYNGKITPKQTFLSEFSDYSSVAKNFLKNGMDMEKSLRNAFRNKVSINPTTLYNHAFQKKYNK